MSDVLDGAAVHAAVVAKMDTLRSALLLKVDANLSGEVLHIRSGTLRASIRSSLGADASNVRILLESADVPYAGIQEYGGRTSAHDIIATKAKALSFIAPNGTVFARMVHHPGSVIPARSYLGSAVADLKPDMIDDLKTAILDVLGRR